MEQEKAAVLFLSVCLLATLAMAETNRAIGLDRLLLSKGLKHPLPSTRIRENIDAKQEYSPVYVGAQAGLKEADRIGSLPGQPDGVPFDQYAGYVTVDQSAGRALFYYFAESPYNSSTNPLLLWLSGGSGCSSISSGAMQALGPFRVNSDNKTLYRNIYAWNNVANVIFLESPAGTGFSYSNRSSDYNTTGDARTAKDAYTFLVNWLERFPEYKNRDLFIAGDGYGGHYVPQLASTILINNRKTSGAIINLKGIAIGNGYIDDDTDQLGNLDYLWTHALISDETYKGILKYCGFHNKTVSEKLCEHFLHRRGMEWGDLNFYNIYAPTCDSRSQSSSLAGSVDVYDPCLEYYVESYLNDINVRKALHAVKWPEMKWLDCGNVYSWTDSPTSLLPEIEHLMGNGVRIWIFSGDISLAAPVTSSRYTINSLKLPVKTAWRPWYSGNEVGGYVVAYEGLTFLTVRGAGQPVPTFQAKRALTMISSFFKGVLPPSSP